jgi:outer membrane protein assembly factor BamB
MNNKSIENTCNSLSNKEIEYIKNRLQLDELKINFIDGTYKKLTITKTTKTTDIILKLKKIYNQQFQLFYSNENEIIDENPINSDFILTNLYEKIIFGLPIYIYNIYLHTDKYIKCINSLNDIQWEFNLNYYNIKGRISSIISETNKIIILTTQNGKIFGINACNGYLLWKYEQEHKINTKPILHDSTFYILTNYTLISLNVLNGNKNWNTQLYSEFNEFSNIKYINPIINNDNILIIESIKNKSNLIGEEETIYNIINRNETIRSYNNNGYINKYYTKIFDKYGEFKIVKSVNNILYIHTFKNYLFAWSPKDGIIWEKFLIYSVTNNCIYINKNIILISIYNQSVESQIIGYNSTSGNELFKFQIKTIPIYISLYNISNPNIIALYYNNICIYNTSGDILYRHNHNKLRFITFNILPNESNLVYFYKKNENKKNYLVLIDLNTFKKIWIKNINIHTNNSFNYITSSNI